MTGATEQTQIIEVRAPIGQIEDMVKTATEASLAERIRPLLAALDRELRHAAINNAPIADSHLKELQAIRDLVG